MTMEIQVSDELDRHHTNADATIIKFKGKRTRRPRPPSPLALTMACSSSSTSESEARTVVPHYRLADEDSDPTTTTTTTTTTAVTASCGSPKPTEEEEEDMANCLILLAQGRGPSAPKLASDHNNDKVEASCAFSCKTCGRSFQSFQALGGHRASHKKPKLNDEDKNNKPVHITMKGKDIGDKQQSVAACMALSLQIRPGATGGPATSSFGSKSSNKVHECSICGAEFNSGQALGGHMRRHRPVMSGSGANNAESESKKGRHGQGLPDLDLNLPAPAMEEEQEANATEYAFASKEQVLVFSTSPLALVDCQY